MKSSKMSFLLGIFFKKAVAVKKQPNNTKNRIYYLLRISEHFLIKHFSKNHEFRVKKTDIAKY